MILRKWNNVEVSEVDKKDGVYRVGNIYEVWIDGEFFGAYINEASAMEAYIRGKVKKR